MLLGVLFACTRNDLELRIQISCSQNDVEVRCVSCSRRHQAPRTLNVDLAQRLLLRGIGDVHEPVTTEAGGFGFVLLDDDKRHWLTRQLTRRVASHPPRSANHIVMAYPIDVAFHFAPPEKLAK